MTVLKTLDSIERRFVLLAYALDKFEARTDDVDHLLEVITLDVETAAFEGTVFGKGRENKMSAGF